MSSDRSVTGCSCEVFAVFVGNVLSFAVFEAFGEAEIDDVDVVTSRVCATDEEVIRFDVSVNDTLLVHFLNATDQLHRNH